VSSSSLNQEKDYVNFGKKVSEVLYQGSAPYRIPAFFKELIRDLGKNSESKKVKEILDAITTTYNEKVKEEKDQEKGGKNKGGKAQLKSGKNIVNHELEADIMGGEDEDYGEEEYGEEGEGGAVSKNQQKKGKVRV
jgi:hypothetical protein